MRHGFWDISGKLKGLTCLYNLAGLKFQSLSHLWWADTELSALLPLFLLLHLGQNAQVRILCYLVQTMYWWNFYFPFQTAIWVRYGHQSCTTEMFFLDMFLRTEGRQWWSWSRKHRANFSHLSCPRMYFKSAIYPTGINCVFSTFIYHLVYWFP